MVVIRADSVSQPNQNELVLCSTFVHTLIKAIVMRTLITGNSPIPKSALMLRLMQKSWRRMVGKVKRTTSMKTKVRND